LLLTAAGDHPERFRSDAGFAALCGVSPLPASAGKTKRHRLNRGGNRQANAALHRIAVVRLRWHEQTQAYAARRTEQGRSKPEILRCLKRFIAREVYRICLADEEPAAATFRHRHIGLAGGLIFIRASSAQQVSCAKASATNCCGCATCGWMRYGRRAAKKSSPTVRATSARSAVW
jgi:hypothetical protein